MRTKPTPSNDDHAAHPPPGRNRSRAMPERKWYGVGRRTAETMSKLIGTNRWSCRLSPTGRSAATSMPSPRRWSAGPMPESWRSWAEPKTPAERITSREAVIVSTPSLVSTSTPVARLPSSTIRRAWAPVRTARLGSGRSCR